MKRTLKQLAIALRWYRMGVTWRKAWYLAKTQYIRQEQYKAEALVLVILFAGYAFVGYQDAQVQQSHVAYVEAHKDAVEKSLAHCLNGKPVQVEDKHVLTCTITRII